MEDLQANLRRIQFTLNIFEGFGITLGCFPRREILLTSARTTRKTSSNAADLMSAYVLMLSV